MDVSTLPVAPVGATSILVIVILLIIRGALIPRSVHEDRMTDKDKQIDYLQTMNAELVAQNSALLTVGHTTERVLLSLREAAGVSEEGQHEVASS